MTQLSTAQVVAGSQVDDVIFAGGASQSPDRDYIITFNGIFLYASIINAEGATETPERDFVLVAGNSSFTGQEYLIFPGSRLELVALSSAVYVNSGLNQISIPLETSVIEVSSTEVKTAIPLETSAVTVQSGELNIIPLKWVAHDTSQVNIESGLLELISLRVYEHQSSLVEVRDSGVFALYLEDGPNFYFADVFISSSLANFVLYFAYKLEKSTILVDSSETEFARKLLVNPIISEIEVRSSTTDLKNNRINAIPCYLGVSSPDTNVRLIPNGVLAGIIPDNRIFSPQAYNIRKLNLAGGRIHRQLLCSARSKAALQLEYINIGTYDARLAVRAFDLSYGTRYGFALPEEIFSGASDQLVDYYRLNQKGLKWYYAQRPTVTFTRKGLANLSVSLQARIDK